VTKITATVGAAQAVLAFLVLIDVIEWSGETIAAFGLGIGAVLTAIGAWFDSSIPFGAKPPS
jgi:hypothetical protein